MDSQKKQQLQDDIQSELSESLKNSDADAQSENKDISKDNFLNLQASFLQKGKAVLIADGGGTMDPPPGTEEITSTMIA